MDRTVQQAATMHLRASFAADDSVTLVDSIKYFITRNRTLPSAPIASGSITDRPSELDELHEADCLGASARLKARPRESCIDRCVRPKLFEQFCHHLSPLRKGLLHDLNKCGFG